MRDQPVTYGFHNDTPKTTLKQKDSIILHRHKSVVKQKEKFCVLFSHFPFDKNALS